MPKVEIYVSNLTYNNLNDTMMPLKEEQTMSKIKSFFNNTLLLNLLCLYIDDRSVLCA